MANIYFGQNAEPSLISKTHGRFVLGFNETFSVDIALNNKKLPFFNKKELLAISVFDGVSGQFGYLETEENYVNAATMDISPSSTITNDDPSAYVEFHILLTAKNESGVVEQATFVKGCRIASAPESMAPRDEQHVQISYIGATRYKVKGGGIKYQRFVASGAAYATAEDIAITGTTGTCTVTATAVNIENNSTTRTYLAVYYNGTDVTKDTAYTTGFSISGTTATFPSGLLTSGTIWEVYIPYNV